MSKSKRKPPRAQKAAAKVSSTQNVKPWVKWVALAIVAALGVSIIAGAITATPAHAATAAVLSEAGNGSGNVSDPSVSPASDSGETPTLYSVDDPTPGTCLLDTDNDGIANPDDSDIDGDGIVNGEDNDIDGDGIVNSQDGDPAATNCYDSKPPIMANSSAPNGATSSTATWGYLVTFGSAFAIVAVVVITLVSKRKKKG